MRYLLFVCLFAMTLPGFGAAGQRDTRGQRASDSTNKPREKVGRQATEDKDRAATTEITTTETVTVDSQICPIDKVKTQLSSYCATVVCDSSMALVSALKLGGTNVDSLDSACQVLIWKEISNRLNMTFLTFKMECDKMNQEYVGAIEEWQTKYNEMAELQAKTKKQRNVAIGVGATTTVGGTIGGYILGQKNPAVSSTDR
ncbi:MAG: hypothetical protein JW812_02575 [Alphaproteobacteria bacterium]|nr:hypothetical protein [Alphaproteobacteria bacterium]MBN2780291.1 hypothetical protein [Alphaproteobacteria bacterium]